MEKNKYYTPDIKEFRIGVEYEEEDSLEDDIWVKRTLDFDYDWLEIHKDFANDKRVKLLDKEDIESFGFIDGVLRDYELRYYDYPRCYCQIYYIPDSRCIFDGIIKNKSELEVVLKQIGVI